MRKFFILVLAAVLICSTAFAITDEQIMQLKDLADRMNDSYAETGTLFQDVYSDALKSYICFMATEYSNSDVAFMPATSPSVSDSIHNALGTFFTQRMQGLFDLGIYDVNVMAIAYSSEGDIIYLGINGENFSSL